MLWICCCRVTFFSKISVTIMLNLEYTSQINFPQKNILNRKNETGNSVRMSIMLTQESSSSHFQILSWDLIRHQCLSIASSTGAENCCLSNGPRPILSTISCTLRYFSNLLLQSGLLQKIRWTFLRKIGAVEKQLCKVDKMWYSPCTLADSAIIANTWKCTKVSVVIRMHLSLMMTSSGEQDSALMEQQLAIYGLASLFGN